MVCITEVFASDVAQAFYHLALSQKTTAAILTVDGKLVCCCSLQVVCVCVCVLVSLVLCNDMHYKVGTSKRVSDNQLGSRTKY